MAMAAATKQLPSGGCNYNFPNLDKDTVCGCQKFWLKRSRRRANQPSERQAGVAQTAGPGARNNIGGDDDDDDDEEQEDDFCRCGHHSCYHSGHPTVAGHLLQHPVALQRHSYGSAAAARRKLSVSTVVDDATTVRADRSANTVALSAISGTTTERDPSTTGTPRAISKPPWTTKASARAREDAPKRLAGQLQHVVTSEGDVGLHMSPPGLEPLPSVSSVASAVDKTYVKEKFRRLIEYTAALANTQMSQCERIEMMEVVPATLEDLADKVDMMDDHVNEKVDSCEVRLKNELDDRLGPIESFIKARETQGGKRKRKQKSRNISGDTNAVQKRRKRRDEKGSAEVVNSQSHGITTTSFTTTSFTTTTSSFSSQNAHVPEYINDLKVMSEIEMLKSRLTDVEASSAPSIARPWIVEVVLIPPGTLKGIWTNPEASNPSTQHTGGEDVSTSTPVMGSPSGSQPLGVVPFAFSPKSKVYKRLYSRGFIKRLHITGPTAREVSFAIETNFHDILEWCATFTISRSSSRARSQLRSEVSGLSSSSASSQRTARGGTRNLWEPLRKIYKQAALEYLTASDLSSPALWTVDFLKANCMMRGTTRKPLYILPRAFNRSNFSGLTWDHIKHLDRYHDHNIDPDVEEIETYWSFDAKLDTKQQLELNTGSFLSEPFASLGPVAAEGNCPSATPAKMSFPPRLIGYQEETPPETVPQLQLRRSSRLNRSHAPTSPPPPENAPTEDDREKNPPPAQRKRSPKKPPPPSIPKIRLPTPSPPSPPLSHPQKQRHRESSSLPLPLQDCELSPTVEDCLPPQNLAGSGNLGFSFEDFAMGVGGWQEDSIGALLRQGWGDNDAGDDEVNWGSLFGSLEEEDIIGELHEEDNENVPAP